MLHRAAVRVHPLQRSGRQRAAAGGNLVEGDPSVSSRTPQASTQTAQSIVRGTTLPPLRPS